MVVELPPAFLVVRVSGVLVGNAVVDADPLVPVVIGPHAVVEHVPPFLDELGEEAAGALVLGVLADVAHEQDDLLAHYGALDGRAAVVQQVPLVFLYRLLYPVVQDLPRRRVLKTERPPHHLVRVLHLRCREAVFVAALIASYNWLVSGE